MPSTSSSRSPTPKEASTPRADRHRQSSRALRAMLPRLPTSGERDKKSCAMLRTLPQAPGQSKMRSQKTSSKYPWLAVTLRRSFPRSNATRRLVCGSTSPRRGGRFGSVLPTLFDLVTRPVTVARSAANCSVDFEVVCPRGDSGRYW